MPRSKEKNFWMKDQDVERLLKIRITLAQQSLFVSLSRIVATGILQLSRLPKKELIAIFAELEKERIGGKE